MIMGNDLKKVFLNTEDGVTYTKTWGGLDFKIVELQDGSIKFYAPDTEVQIVTPRDEESPFYTVSLFGGKGFIRFIESDREPGTYFASLTITEDAKLPPNPNFKKKGRGNKKAYGKKPSWKKKW
jgi:hypothetical protein